MNRRPLGRPPAARLRFPTAWRGSARAHRY